MTVPLSPAQLAERADEKAAYRMLGVLEEMAMGVALPNMFSVFKDGKEYAVPPDKAVGIFEAIRARFQRERSWDRLEKLERDLAWSQGEVWRLQQLMRRCVNAEAEREQVLDEMRKAVEKD